MLDDGNPEARQAAFVLITCEHGGSEVPPAYESLFRGADEVLVSHRGLDIGALGVGLRMSARLAAPIIFSTVTRLLIDLNRSLDAPDLFSDFARVLRPAERDRVIAEHYLPYRNRVRTVLGQAIQSSSRRVLHVSVHSCVDELDGLARELDVSLLFDPARAVETALCEAWRGAISQRRPDLRLPFNEPYLGTDDGLTTALRVRFPGDLYAGIEIEIRQSLIKTSADQQLIGDILSDSLRQVLFTWGNA